jgi:D-alanyl-D-alanine carboxypeptidase (penicillin-binding protein 5/6)
MTILGVNPPAGLVRNQELPAAKVAQAEPSAPVPIAQNASQPNVYAASVYVVDATTGTVLYQKNADVARPIASLTKMMTVLTILRNHNQDEQVTVPQLEAYMQGDALAGLTPGDTFVLKDLVAAALIPSDNDAADTLAIYDSGTKEKFYGKMNTIAKEWGMTDATFASASGLQDAGNLASAKDLATIARLGLKNKLFSQLTATKTMKVTSGQGKVYTLETTNDLLDGVKVFGVKTGYTPIAGECLVTLSKINGHDIITVVLASPDRFGETTRILDWVTNNYSWYTTK